MTIDRLPKTLTCRAGITMPGEKALEAAAEAYTDYTASGYGIEHLARLSIAARTSTAEACLTALGYTIVGLGENGYLELARETGGKPRLTERGKVAISLVQGEAVGDDIDAWLQEPFTTYPVLGILPSMVGKVRTDRAKRGHIFQGDTFGQTFTGLTQIGDSI